MKEGSENKVPVGIPNKLDDLQCIEMKEDDIIKIVGYPVEVDGEIKNYYMCEAEVEIDV